MIGNTTQLTYTINKDYAEVDAPCATGAIPNVCQPRKALPETTLYVPLQFWFCRNPGLALPFDCPSIPRSKNQPRPPPS